MRSNRQNMNSLYNMMKKTGSEMDPDVIAPHIKKLPNVMKLIREKKGGPTGK